MIQSLNFKLHFIRRNKIDKVLFYLILLFSLFRIVYDLSDFLVIATHNKQKPEIETQHICKLTSIYTKIFVVRIFCTYQ